MTIEVTPAELKEDLVKFARWLRGELRLVEDRLCRLCHLRPPAHPGHAACEDCEKELGHG